MSDEADKVTCGAQTTARDVLGDIIVECGLMPGHDAPRPVFDWATCARCGGTKCKGVANGSDHTFLPTVTGFTAEPHRFCVEWI